jgi:exodeoxyribonuclease VII large subunit
MEILSVAQFNAVLNQIFSDLQEFEVEGEVISMKINRNRALFMELKDPDEQAILKVSNFAPWVKGLKQISEGMKVTVKGRPEIYSKYGNFSFKPREIKPAGEGALKIAFENLVKALELEGLFAEERKRELPEVVTKIALITAKGSAAYEDFTKILHEHSSAIEVEFFPVSVQGHKSEAEVVAALKANYKRDDLDAIIMTRGGGSLEDLASFNAEMVARTIFASEVPVLVGVGHEVDISVADMVADVRASTPSQAAYYLVSRNANFLENVEDIIDEMQTTVDGLLPSIESLDTAVSYITNNLHRHIPKAEVVDPTLRIMRFGLDRVSNLIEDDLQLITDCLNLNQLIYSAITNKKLEVDNLSNLIRAYNPQNVLNRGYALISKDGKYIDSTFNLKLRDKISLRFKDGAASAKVEEVMPAMIGN